MAVFRETKGRTLTVILLDNAGQPTDIGGRVNSYKLPEITTSVTKKQYAGYRGKISIAEGEEASDFSCEMESCSSELRDICIDSQKLGSIVSIQLTVEMANIEDGADVVEEIYTITGRITKTPLPMELNGSDFAKSEIMMSVESYTLPNGRTWSATKGWS